MIQEIVEDGIFKGQYQTIFKYQGQTFVRYTQSRMNGIGLHLQKLNEKT